jgi:ribosomal protein L37AE/L43A
VLSLDNLRHGLPVDHIEACKTCHVNETELGFTFMENIHRIHMRSRKFPVLKNDCTTCHFTRESTTRPSIYACASCHLAVHGTEYFQQRFENRTEPSRYGNCAQQCHGEKPPVLHILPEF